MMWKKRRIQTNKKRSWLRKTY